LRQFALECSARRRDSRLDAESLETLNETDGIFCFCDFLSFAYGVSGMSVV